MMDADRFWTIVEGVTPSADTDPEGFDGALASALSSMSADEILAFDERWDALARRALTWDLWAAAWVVRGGCFDWEFHGFRDRLVASGRTTFERAVEDPDSLADAHIDWTAGDDEGDAWLSTATAEAYERVTGKGLDEADADSEPEPYEPAGERWTVSDVAQRVPRLVAKTSYTPGSVALREPCPCCGNLTIEEPGEYDICEVCWWEDDDLDRDHPDEISGPNGLSLNDARENYRRFGACDERSRGAVRPPRPWEVPEAAT